MKKHFLRFCAAPFIAVILILSFIGGCAVSYVADYDASLRDEIIQVAKKVDRFWGSLLDTEPAERKYADFKNRYNEIESDLRGLVMRNRIRELNEESTRQAEIALELWIEDRNRHKKEDQFSDFLAKRHRRDFERIFFSMIKGEAIKNI